MKRKMKLIFAVITSIIGVHLSYAEDMNAYFYFYNLSTKYNMEVSYAGANNWDNRGWDPCSPDENPSNLDTLGSGVLKCGGTTSGSFEYYGYQMTVKPKGGSNILFMTTVFALVNYHFTSSVAIVDPKKPIIYPIIKGNHAFKLFRGYTGKDAIVLLLLTDDGIMVSVRKEAKDSWIHTATASGTNYNLSSSRNEQCSVETDGGLPKDTPCNVLITW